VSKAKQRRRRPPQPRPQPNNTGQRSADTDAVAVERFSWRRIADMFAGAAAVLGPLVLYVMTMPRSVSLEDDGLFLLVGKYLGVGHPPGYPVHTVLSNLFLKAPWGSEAFLGHLLSGVLGALACGAVYWCARLLKVGPIAALVGAWLFGASEHYWAQAIITEVYTLNALLFFVVFALLLHLGRSPTSDRAWTALAVVYGLSLANHWPLMVLATPGLALALLPVWREFRRRWLRLTAVFLPAVAGPYLWMVLRSRQEPDFSFPGPLDTFDRVWGHITREGYRDVDSSVSAGWSDRIEFFAWFGTDVVWQMTLFGFVFALAGLGVLLSRPAPDPEQQQRRGRNRRNRNRRNRNRRYGQMLEWLGRFAGPVVFMSQSLLLVLLLNFDFDYQHTYVFRAYPSVSYGLLGIWVAMGLHAFGHWLHQQFSLPRLAGSVVVAGTGLAMVAWSVAGHWEANNRSDADFAQRYSEMIFEILPEDAVLITFGDEIVLPLAYNHFADGRRPDIRYSEAHGIMFKSNLYGSIADISVEEQQAALLQFLETTDRPVFQTYRTNRVDHGRAVRDYGFLREVLEDENPDESIQLLHDDTAAAYFEYITTQTDLRGWERVARSHQVIDYSQFLGYALLSENEDIIEQTAASREVASKDYYGLNGMAGILARHGNDEQLEQAMEFLRAAEPMQGEAVTKQAESEIFNNMGIVLWRQGGCDGETNNMGSVRWRQRRCDEAIRLFETSRDIVDDPANPGVDFLNQLANRTPVPEPALSGQPS